MKNLLPKICLIATGAIVFSACDFSEVTTEARIKGKGLVSTAATPSEPAHDDNVSVDMKWDPAKAEPSKGSLTIARVGGASKTYDLAEIGAVRTTTLTIRTNASGVVEAGWGGDALVPLPDQNSPLKAVLRQGKYDSICVVASGPGVNLFLCDGQNKAQDLLLAGKSVYIQSGTMTSDVSGVVKGNFEFEVKDAKEKDDKDKDKDKDGKDKDKDKSGKDGKDGKDGGKD